MVKLSSTKDAKILPLVSNSAAERAMTFASLLDVGASDRPLVDWFLKFRHAIEPHKYTAVEVDPTMVERLKVRQLDVSSSIPTDTEGYDLTLACEVIEHIKAEQSVDFLTKCAKATRKMFALTTPNFEYWDNFRQRDEVKECRWLPDHVRTYKPGSKDPHAHQQEMTPSNLSSYMQEAFPADAWDVTVYRAWPWSIKDVAREREYLLYFKLFATALKRERNE